SVHSATSFSLRSAPGRIARRTLPPATSWTRTLPNAQYGRSAKLVTPSSAQAESRGATPAAPRTLGFITSSDAATAGFVARRDPSANAGRVRADGPDEPLAIEPARRSREALAGRDALRIASLRDVAARPEIGR